MKTPNRRCSMLLCGISLVLVQAGCAPRTPGSEGPVAVDGNDIGGNIVINTGNASEALLALTDSEWVVLRVPYPTGFYTKWMDGRIDDPDAGWKGGGSGRRSARARPSTSRPAVGRRVRSCSSSSGRTPSHVDVSLGADSGESTERSHPFVGFRCRGTPIAALTRQYAS